jgi:hypothetical protein
MPGKGKKGGLKMSDVKDAAKTVHKFVKENKLISNAAAKLGHPMVAAAANALGYGKKKRRTRRKKGKGIGSFFKGLVSAPLAGITATAGTLLGGIQGMGKRGGYKLPSELSENQKVIIM